MVRPPVPTAIAVILLGDDIARLATRTHSLSSNLSKFEGLRCRVCEVGRSEYNNSPAVSLIFEVPLWARVWTGRTQFARLEDAVRRWVRRWHEDRSHNEFSVVDSGSFGDFLAVAEYAY